MIRVIVADDHNLVRQGIRALLEKDNNIKVVGEARDGVEALELVKYLKPDILVVDINMPKIDGIEVIKRISQMQLRTRTVILSMYLDESLVKKAIKSGAEGYLVKQSITEDLIKAVYAVYANEIHLSPLITQKMNLEVILSEAVEDDDPFERLSAREREICKLVAEGHTNQAVATDLGISIKTVEKHRANIMYKLGLHDTASLVREAIRHNLIFLES
jgi:two-component system response regulator NreC